MASSSLSTPTRRRTSTSASRPVRWIERIDSAATSGRCAERLLGRLGLYDDDGQAVREHVVQLARDPGALCRSGEPLRSRAACCRSSATSWRRVLITGTEQPGGDQREVPAEPVEDLGRGGVLGVEDLAEARTHRDGAQRGDGRPPCPCSRHRVAEHQSREERAVAFRRPDRPAPAQPARPNPTAKAMPGRALRRSHGGGGDEVGDRDDPAGADDVRAEQAGRQHVDLAGRDQRRGEGHIACGRFRPAPSCDPR